MAIASECGVPVLIEVSASDPANANRKIKGIVQEGADKQLTFTASETIAVATSVRVQSKDILYLGEVLRCVPDHGDQWLVEIRVQRSMLIM